MIYPEYLKKGCTIGVTATSDGVNDELDKKRFISGKIKLENLDYKVKFTDNVFMADEKGRSSSGFQRAAEFNELVNDNNVKAIIAAKGGNFLNEMLEFVDFEKMTYTPKWFQGYSDNTGIVHTLTTKYDIASIYGSNFGEFGMDEWHESVVNNLSILEGKNILQQSFRKYQKELTERVTGVEGYFCDEKVQWKIDSQTLKKSDSIVLSGRLIGGCLDVLLFLEGTKYDGTLEYIEKYKNDGIIWFIESFDISGENLMMFLWKLKEIGWFKYTKGIMFGRPLFYKDYTNTSYEEAIMYALGNLDIPILFDCDFGHLGPRMTMVNGAYATISCENNSIGKIVY